MIKLQRSNILYWCLIALIVCISFFFFSLRFYPLLTSDDTLNILMAFYYKLPSDFYCWGQDRGGTLIPLISQIFIKIFHFSPISAVSLSNYLVLFLGFIGYTSLFKKKSSKILFAILWFLPFERFLGLLRFPLGVEYSLIGFSIFLLSFVRTEESFFKFKNQVLIIMTVIVLILTVWASDVAVFTIIILFSVLLFFSFKEKINKRFILFSVVYFVIGAVACRFFISYAKSFANAVNQNYLTLNSFSQVKEAFLIVLKNIIDILSFKIREPLVGVWSWLVLSLFATIPFLLISVPGFAKKLLSNKWFVFFIADFLMFNAILLLAKWVLLNKMGVWYFVPVYFTLAAFVLLIYDTVTVNNFKVKLFKVLLVATFVLGAVSPFISMKFYVPGTLRPYADVKRELNVLGKSGFIGEFWNSYVSSCSNPEIIIATPHDKSSVRNPELVDKVFENENIYLIKDMWLDSFPDTIVQFGHLLVREGQSFKMGDCEINKYRKAKSFFKFDVQDLMLNKSLLVYDDEINRQVFYIPYSCDTCKQQFVVKTVPFTLKSGDYLLSYNLKVENFVDETASVYFEVTSDWGNTKIFELFTYPKDYLSEGYNNFNIEFSLETTKSNVEIKVYYHGNCDFYFSGITLAEK